MATFLEVFGPMAKAVSDNNIAWNELPDRFSALFTDGGLYQSIQIPAPRVFVQASWRDHLPRMLDLDCLACERERVHKLRVLREIVGTRCTYVAFECAACENPDKRIEFYLDEIKEHSIAKAIRLVGMTPSPADLFAISATKYRAVLNKAERRDLRAAGRVRAVGLGSAAFLYVRRLIERLIDKAQQSAESDGVAVAADFAGLRTKDRIARLGDYLPEFLVENKALYSILSIGVHELSDKEATKHLPLMFDALSLMLDDLLRRRSRSDTAIAISRTAEDIKPR